MALADYLAQKYLSADQNPTKKRKRKDKAQISGLVVEDDENDWKRIPDENGDEETPVMVGGLSGGLNKPSKQAKWIKIGSDTPKDADQVAADAILANAQKDAAIRARQDDDAPAVVGDDGEGMAGPMMSSGAMAGLQTAEQVTKALKKRERAEKKAMEAQGLDPSGKAQETIYRDASGRVINVAMKRVEMRHKQEEEERKKREDEESRKGDVQRQQKAERQQLLQDAKGMTFARGADDKALNEEQMAQERWNDPMARLMGDKKSGGKGGKRGKTRRTYQGGFEPNRYGIRPGWRWDGVDRSNGFERKWFAARNKAREREELEYAWQMDE
ncbi:hypothetical protein K431DRAFT_220601 [Polychaeton citri CBS 116435]|uniref:Pre-mRNA-splicing factor CWC26 n=1 Tax=Polychaeton citri CBS 116435 TaxID=1314669 RepID=A0A9P4URV4_9PEZI|nr:hypothetical protein K431DRAFT_220601 [Polychaeton citri CBS 116435]